MAYPKKTPAVQFHVDCTPEAKSRFATLHEAFDLKTKSATFEAVLLAVSIKDKIDPQILSAPRSQARPSPRKLRQPMKAGMIFARKTTWRSRLDLEYLDETSSRKVSSRQQQDDGQKRIRPLPQFADYASKESLGQVHAGGFLHHLILTTRTVSHRGVANDERRTQEVNLGGVVRAHSKISDLSQNPVIQHRLVFSMSREMHDKLVEAGINPDRVLQTTTKKIMGKFNERFHPADSIGYAYGIHHDTDNLHVHIAPCPRTARGAYVGAARHGTRRRDTRTR